jgi:Domain of unknown function (DUF1877)
MTDALLARVPGRQVDELLTSGEAVRATLRASEGEPGRSMTLEDWPAIHFVLTGEAPIPREEAIRRGIEWHDDALENALLGGVATPFGSSFGPARCLRPDEVSQMARELEAVDVDDLVEQFDPEALEEEGIPPPGWNEEPERADHLAAAVGELASFYRTAAAHGDGLLIVFG